jgi:TRAP-type C4-dicarboxylate transport system substrate-binding protein
VVAIGVPHYLSKKPIRRIADFGGQKIRVNATKIEQEMMRRVGATAAPMPLSEVQPALQQGVIDGIRSIMSIFTVGKYESIAKTVTVTNDAVLISLAALSKPWLDKQPADIRAILIEEGRAAMPESQKWAGDFIGAQAEKWKQVGGEVIELPADERAEIARRFAPIGDDVAKENPAAKALYDRIVASAKKHS